MRVLVHSNFEMGDRGKARRIALGLTVAEVARRMRSSVQRVYMLESQGCGTLHLCERWALALEMDPRVLAFGPMNRAETHPASG